MNNLILAYLGDAVWELIVREHLINGNIKNVNGLQKEAVKYVSAKGEVSILESLKLTEEEENIVRRGRNTHSHSIKSTDIVTYKKSTGFECLIGYLYLNDKERLEEIVKEVFNGQRI